MKCEFEPLNNIKVQVKLSLSIFSQVIKNSAQFTIYKQVLKGGFVISHDL